MKKVNYIDEKGNYRNEANRETTKHGNAERKAREGKI